MTQLEPSKTTEKMVIFCLKKKQPFWTRYRYGKRIIMMSFQYDIFLMNEANK